ncbi:hypothetical protein AKJ16_DCAP04438, partial [Drosera capensis]
MRVAYVFLSQFLSPGYSVMSSVQMVASEDLRGQILTYGESSEDHDFKNLHIKIDRDGGDWIIAEEAVIGWNAFIEFSFRFKTRQSRY